MNMMMGFFTRFTMPFLLTLLAITGLLSACTSDLTAGAGNDQAKSSLDDLTLDSKPLIAQRADPWVYRAENGHYYFIATSPKFDKIAMRSADTVRGLANAPETVIWRKHDTGARGANIWAPELHRIDGVWYIYFAAAPAEKPWLIRMQVLANASADPLQGQWQELGPVENQRDAFSLDATEFAHNGKHYLIWAQKDPEETLNSALYIAELTSPTELGGKQIEISRPELSWETVGYKVNEGAAVLIKNGKVFVTYSASATDHNYAMGLLWADENADLLDAAAWHKSPQPVFYTNAALKRFGPGHNSFTLAEDGKTTLMVYHARDYRELKGTPLTDINRHTYVRKLLWDKDGMPDFAQSLSDAETFAGDAQSHE